MKNETQKTTITAEVWKNSFKKALKILFIVLVAGFYLNLIIVALSPRFSAKVYNFMGFDNAEEYCLEKTYEKTKSNADLYNLIVFEQSQKDYQKELNYINLLFVSCGYDEFCKNLDESALKAIEDKSLVAHLCDTNAYLINQKVKCLFNLGIDAETFVYSNLKGDYLTENSYASYIQLIYDSNLSKEKKQEMINTLNNTSSLQNGVVEDLFKERIADLILAKQNAEKNNEKILIEYSLMENYKAGYLYNLILENSTQAEAYKTLYSESASAYYQLIK